MKKSLIIVALALLACLVVLVVLVMLRSRPDGTDELAVDSVSDTSRGPSFAVRVIMPRLGLPLGGILPDWLVSQMDGTPRELRFDQTNGGARIGRVGHDRVELTADGWDLLIETDAAGRIAQGTRLVLPLALGGRRLRLSCRPADPGIGQFQVTTRAGSNELVGRFVVEFDDCKNAESGKDIEWPPAPLTVRGSFVSPPQGHNRTKGDANPTHGHPPPRIQLRSPNDGAKAKFAIGCIAGCWDPRPAG